MLNDLGQAVYEAVIVVNEVVIATGLVVSISEREATTAYLLKHATVVNDVPVPENRDKNDVEVLVHPF